MKILDVSQAITKLDKDIDQLQRRLDFLDLIDVGIERVLNMDGAFTGEGGEAIILNHAELQLPTIRAFRAHITTTIEKIKKMKAYILEFEPSENGVVTEDFWDTQMTRGLDKVEQSTEQSKQKVDEYAASVSHIMNLGKLDIDQVLNGIESSRKFASEVVDELYMLDNDGVDLMADVQASRTELDAIVQKAVEWTNAGGPLLQGVNIQDVKSHFKEMTLHKEAPGVDMARLNRGDDRSLVQGVVNFLGQDFKNVYDWGTVIRDGARGAATAIMFGTKMLEYNPHTKKLDVKSTWKSNGGVYESKWASKLRNLHDPTRKSFINPYAYKPSELLKGIAGLRNVSKIGIGELLNRTSGPIVSYRNGQEFVNNFNSNPSGKFFKSLGNNLKQNFIPTIKSIDVNKSLKNLKNLKNIDVKESLKKLNPRKAGWQKNLARGANVLAVGLNFMEAFSDKHKDKSVAERTGRALTGSALDIGAGTAGAASGAAFGTMIFPGVGTVVGGIVGAAAGGYLANKHLGESVRKAGERIGSTVEKGWNKAKETVSNVVNDVKEGAKNLLSGGAKALGSLFG
ncbi:T7SS effector LXG polymorphic toxin [Siminovitchia sp. FSL W7-1587]|uniref:T7SS effector LXG polymorphic toxin n=1 Tax=Siminovitchia sp. FSL W7-1587 TaxID=2954699 RepID=UPI0030D09C5D